VTDITKCMTPEGLHVFKPRYGGVPEYALAEIRIMRFHGESRRVCAKYLDAARPYIGDICCKCGKTARMQALDGEGD